MTDALPRFRYHPDPLATGSVVAQDAPCTACGRARGFIDVGPVYGADELTDGLCPWCIEDGTAAQRTNAVFTDTGWGVSADVPSAVFEVLERRTPGFIGWQQEHWLYHCGDAAALLGPVGSSELRDHPDAVEMLRQEWEDSGEGSDGWEPYLTALDREGGSTAYLFRCLHCGAHLAYSDFE